MSKTPTASAKLNLSGLGSFESLLDAAPPPDAAGLRELPIDQVAPDPNQPRKNFDPARMAELADSIRVHGVIQPLVVRATPGGFVIFAGERRWRAAKQAGLATVPVIVREDLSARAQMVENLQREDLSPYEIYRVIAAELDRGATQADLVRDYGKSKSWVSEYASVGKMPAALIEALRAGYAQDIYALSALNRLHKRAPERVETLAGSGAQITRGVVEQFTADLEAEAGAGSTGSTGNTAAPQAPSKDPPKASGDKSPPAATGTADPSGAGNASGNDDGQQSGQSTQAAGASPLKLLRIRVEYDGQECTVRYTSQSVRNGIRHVVLELDGGVTLSAPMSELRLVGIGDT